MRLQNWVNGLLGFLLFLVFFFFKKQCGPIQFLALCSLANSKPRSYLLVAVIIEVYRKCSLYVCSVEKFSFQHLFDKHHVNT